MRGTRLWPRHVHDSAHDTSTTRPRQRPRHVHDTPTTRPRHASTTRPRPFPAGIGFAKDQGPLGAIAATQCLSKEKTRAKARAGGVPAEFEDYSSRKDAFGRWKMARSVGVGT